MKVRLLDSKKDAADSPKLPAFAELLYRDLELEQILETMARGDDAILESARETLLAPLTDREEILRRQAALQDCLDHPEAIRGLYQSLTDTLEARKQDLWWLKSNLPSSRFASAVELLQRFHDGLWAVRRFADRYGEVFRSEAFRSFCREMQTQLDDEFLSRSRELLRELSCRDGVLIELTLDRQQHAAGYHLVRKAGGSGRLRWAVAPSFTLAERDETGAQDLRCRKDAALGDSAELLSDGAWQLEHFFRTLHRELAFYLGALQLRETLETRQIPCCMPTLEEGPGDRSFRDLRDLSLALRIDGCVGNGLEAAHRLLYVVTGANQGGKTTFLRSLGQAQLLAQSGLFVAAEQFASHICQGIFTHFNREEDETLHSGKLDEELRRLDGLVERLRPGSLLLYNEFCASTNEREGSEICFQITRALLEHGIEQVHVTHLYPFAHRLEQEDREQLLFLRAERLEDGSRSFRIRPGLPEQTAFGEDLYRAVWQTGGKERKPG